MDQPDTLLTLAAALQTKKLAPIDRQRIRAQFSMLNVIRAADIRRATELVLARITAYYQVIGYTGPEYVYGRVDSEFPSALCAKPELNYMYNTWSYREMSPTHPICTVERLFNEAGFMCIQTACKVAADELSKELPESKELFVIAGRAVQSMIKDRDISGISWRDSMRRLRTPGIRKALKALSWKLADVHIGWTGVFFPVVVPVSHEQRLAIYSDIKDWSYANKPAVAA